MEIKKIKKQVERAKIHDETHSEISEMLLPPVDCRRTHNKRGRKGQANEREKPTNTNF